MSLADEWHHPDGPESLPVKYVIAEDPVEFIHRTFAEAQYELLAQEAEEMTPEEEAEACVYRGPDYPIL